MVGDELEAYVFHTSRGQVDGTEGIIAVHYQPGSKLGSSGDRASGAMERRERRKRTLRVWRS